MSNLRIPEDHRAGIMALASMDDRTVDALQQAFTTEEDDFSSHTVARNAAATLGDIPTRELYDVISALRSLQSVRSGSESSLESFVDDLAEALDEAAEGSLEESLIERFKNRVALLVKIDPFAIHAEAIELQQDDERTFCRVRILTDLRPLFEERSEDGIRGAVIVHLLKLGYHQSGQSHQDFYVSLDANDLATLKRAIEKAEVRADTLRKAFPGVQYLGL